MPGSFPPIYAGYPEDHCYFVSIKELPRFLLYISRVVENYINHQMDQISSIKSPPMMKQFYKQEWLTNLAVFGSLAGCFLSYLFFPYTGWWNLALLFMGAGGVLMMAGFYARLFHLSQKKKREIIAENFSQISPGSRRKIGKKIKVDLFRKTFFVEFSTSVEPPMPTKIPNIPENPLSKAVCQAEVQNLPEENAENAQNLQKGVPQTNLPKSGTSKANFIDAFFTD